MTHILDEDSPFSLLEASDFWRYEVGVNVIPADTRNKTTSISWKQYQDSPIPEWKHKEWQKHGAYNGGMVIILGPIWHNSQKQGLYLNGIDCDNAKGIEEICTHDGEHVSIERLGQWTLVEQHPDDTTKMHVLVYSHKPFAKKSTDKVAIETAKKIDSNEIPAIEVKSTGSILFCSPFIHKNGAPYEILGTHDPVIADDFEAHIDTICRKYGLGYLREDSVNNDNGNSLIPIARLFNEDYKVIEGHNRHEALLRAMESLLSRNGNILELDKIKDLARELNSKHCDPPLDENEFQKQWRCASKFIGKRASKSSLRTERLKKDNIIRDATETILSQNRFLTIEESKEILYYNGGAYVTDGEVLIEKTAERLFGYKLANRHLTEIKGHIMRVTYHKQEELDSNINILNLSNGLYNIETGEFKEHTPDYLSITQKPIMFNPAARPRLFGKFLGDVLYPSEIRTAVDVIAYSLYRDNPFEVIVKLFGYGANGKSVFTGLLTALHGVKNVSNVPLYSMLKNRFALSDLENKYVNIDTELPSTTIHDTAILKKVTGRQPVRIERKNQNAYDVTLYSKLFFSANKIPETEDESDAYFRRVIIISFPNKFQDGKNADPGLLKKLTTTDELSGIFNLLIKALKRLLPNGIFIKEKTIEERRERHELAVNPIGYFVRDAIVEESVESDTTIKETLYQAYIRFCSERQLAVESKESFGKILKSKHGFQDGRESSGERRTVWKGVKLTAKYNLEEERQRTLL